MSTQLIYADGASSLSLSRVLHGLPIGPLWVLRVRSSLRIPMPFQLIFLFIVQWTKKNPTPWNEIKPNQGTKLIQINQKFDERCVYVTRSVLFLLSNTS
ncbi:hypothetical protein K435DRAFT_45908 [Dendrothele bispora CBS 962.96]|uniref:Uncharacterized protein n=1 Tax=Dendrothele bispora (strain CBS 962.96) TaxID=1314807 RepID=A0A4S8KSK9_DENBC|nr:hypothetical protein K435DRAFT_45908 [Dendrothele bispora CBS 962.96]